MSKRIVHELTYDAPAAVVYAMLGDPAFRQEVCDRIGCSRAEVSIDHGSSGMEVTLDQWQPTAGMPSFAKKIVGEETNVVQQESWTSPTAADVTVTIPGKPGDMSGTAVLSESGGVTTETVDLTVKVAIPLLGGKLEGLIAGLLTKALDAENAVGREWLAHR